MKDTIYRQEAIMAFDDAVFCSHGYIVDVLKGLSSAQSIYTDEEIQKMQDLESAEIEKAYQLGYEDGKKDAQPDVPDINVGDMVSRQAAIVAVKDALLAWSSMPEWRDDKITEALVELPSAQPDIDEWCPDCKEYDSKRHCCPRLNRVIRETLKDGRTKGVWLSKYLPICIGAKEIVEVYICSNCGHVVDSNDLSNFCSVCGCDMRGDDSENN